MSVDIQPAGIGNLIISAARRRQLALKPATRRLQKRKTGGT